MNNKMKNYNRVADGIDKRFFYIGRNAGKKVMDKHDAEYIRLNKMIKLW